MPDFGIAFRYEQKQIPPFASLRFGMTQFQELTRKFSLKHSHPFCHPERSECFAKRSAHEVEGPLRSAWTRARHYYLKFLSFIRILGQSRFNAATSYL
jgi:hypothetical protein